MNLRVSISFHSSLLALPVSTVHQNQRGRDTNMIIPSLCQGQLDDLLPLLPEVPNSARLLY